MNQYAYDPAAASALLEENGCTQGDDGIYVCDGTRLSPGPRRPAGRPPRPTGTCCGVDYPRLASGEADVAAYLKQKPWDHLPGGLLLAEAGGSVRRWGPLLVARRG